MAFAICGAAVSLVVAICGGAAGDGCAMIGGGFTDGFVKAFTPTYDREIASTAAMPMPIGLSFRASQNCGSSSASADLGGVIGTFGAGMTFGVANAGFSTGGGLTGGSATAFFSSRVLATFGGTTGAGFSGSLTVSCLFCCIGAAVASFGRASSGLGTLSGAGGFKIGTGTGGSIARFDSTFTSGTTGTTGSIARFDSTLTSDITGTTGSVARFDSTLASDTTGTGSFGEAGGICVGGDDGSTASTGVGKGVTGTGGGTGFVTAGLGAGVDTVGGFQGRTAAGVRSTGAVGGVASGETVELPGRAVNPADECPGTRGTMPSAFKISRNT